MPRFFAALLTFLLAIVLTGGLSWFALRNYKAAAPVAAENLRGLALTMATAMEGMAARDPSLQSLTSFKTAEIAYAALLSDAGKILFHTNPRLIGSVVADGRYLSVLTAGELREERIRLGTGETIYEFQTPIHLSGQTCILRLALHTWRAESVMRRARQGVTVIFALLILGWGLGLSIFWLLRQQARREGQIARQQELTRLGEVGAVLAHEIRNPLAGIKGYGQLLEERLADGKERGFASLIVNEAQRLEGLANDILLYTRTDSFVASSCQFTGVAGSVQALLAPQAQAQGIRFSSEFPEDLMVGCSADGLHQLLLNLLMNGMQAAALSSSVGIVTVLGRLDGKWVEIRVSDNGPGIAPEMENVLFDPFRTSKARGAGLGLAVCKKIVEACGGSIEARNRCEGGAEFIVRLPAVENQGNKK
jgi:two-component system, NtrC family, sensor histidine kinase HydH